MSYEIFKATLDDAEEILAFINEVIVGIPDTPYEPGWVVDSYPDLDLVKEDITADTSALFYIRDDAGKIVAAVTLNNIPDSGYKLIKFENEFPDEEILMVHRLCTLPSLMNQGLGSKLIDHAKKYAKETGCKAIRLDVTTATNEPAMRWYEHQGFNYVGHGPIYIDMGEPDVDYTVYEFLIK